MTKTSLFYRNNRLTTLTAICFQNNIVTHVRTDLFTLIVKLKQNNEKDDTEAPGIIFTPEVKEPKNFFCLNNQ